MTRLSLARGIVAAGLLAAVPPALAETFVLANGDVIEGSVVRSLGNTLSIKLDTAGMLQIPIASVERIELATPDGGVVGGRLVGWSNGTYRLSTEQGVLEARVEGGVVVALDGESAQGGEAIGANAPARSPSADPAATPAATTGTRASSSALRAGFVYVGPIDDGGRTFMHEKGRLRLANNPVVEDTMVLEIGVEDGERSRDAIDQLIADGANLVFMTGNDSTATMVEAARQHADVQFVHCGAFTPSANIDVFCGRIYQARYLTGIVAGGMTQTGLIGYVAAEPTPQTIVGINAFTLGAQSVNPDVQVIVNWTQSFYAPGRAQRRAEELIERGVDILTIHQDSPAALQVAEKYGIGAIGYQSDMSAFAPSATLTSAIWNWGEMYDQIIDRLTAGESQLRPTWLGIREGVVGLAPLSSRVPDDLKRLVQQRQRELIDGRFNIFTGPIRDVDGDVRVLDGRIMTDESLQTMDYLIEGVVGY